MRKIQSIFQIKYALIGLVILLGCERRKLEDLQPLSFPAIAEVFIDDFTGDLAYSAFGGSNVTAFQVDNQVTYNGTRQSMRFDVPDANSPNGSYAGGVFFSKTGRDLSGYNALTFYIKASQGATIGEIGLGNDLGANKFLVTMSNLPVNTSWKKVIIPIPDASKLKAEKGLLYYATGPENNKGYSFWIDEVRFEKLGDITNLTGIILGGQDRTIANAETGDKITMDGFRMSVTLPTGVNQSVNISPYYLNFVSSNNTIAGVDGKGVVSVIEAGTTTITAKLGDKVALGSLKLTSTGNPVMPTIAAPTPPARQASDVISLYSNAYTNVPVDTWNTRWQFSTADEYFIKVQNNDVIRYRNLNFVGITFPLLNIAGMKDFHIDIWTPNPTDAPNNFKVLLVDFGANGAAGGGDDTQHEVTITAPTLKSNEWVSLDIPMSSFTGLTNRTKVAQLVLSGTIPNLYMDNVYFHRPPVVPTVAAPVPTKPANDVVSIFSDTYTNVAGTDFNPNWGQSTAVTQTPIAGNNTLRYASFNYQGLQLGSVQNVSGYGFLHVDFYSANATTLRVFLINIGGAETPYNLTVPTTGWNSVDIPLSAFAPVNLANVGQFKFDGNGDVFLDNIYFWRNPIVPLTAAPVPTTPSADVISIFSDSYTNVAGVNLNPFWGQNTVATQTPIAGNNTLRYANFNYQGIEFNAQNVSAYNFLHIDYYSTNANTLRVFAIKAGGVEVPYTLTVPTAGWNSVNIPLSAFSPVDLTAINQFKFDDAGNNAGKDIFIDNIYFYKTGGGGGGGAFSLNSVIDFETSGFGAGWTWNVFENAGNPPLEFVNNPFPTGINTSAKVAKFTANQAGNPWAGCETAQGQMGTFNLDAAHKIVKIMVYKTTTSDVGIKFAKSDGWSMGEIKVPNTAVNTWQELTFDFTSQIQNGYTQIIVFPDFTARGANNVIYFDNIRFGN